MGTVHTNVKSQNTEFGQNVPITLGVTPINVFQNQNRSQSKRVLNKTDVQDLADCLLFPIFPLRMVYAHPLFPQHKHTHYRLNPEHLFCLKHVLIKTCFDSGRFLSV